jgi:hypothetical protein
MVEEPEMYKYRYRGIIESLGFCIVRIIVAIGVTHELMRYVRIFTI